MSEVTEKIKERLGIVDVISTYLKLEKAGSSMKAKCPFHNEKTPSFSVSPQRGTYYCFGCGAKGDIFSFVQEFEGVDFPGALKSLGERAGVPIAFENKEQKDKRTRHYQILETATTFYEAERKKNKDVNAYLKKRGLTKDTTEKWRIGYAPSAWYAGGEALEKKGFTQSEMEHVGLIKKGEKGSYYDRFRDRIMFPITDSSGRVVAYSGRIFSGDDEKAAKYVNSPETSLFNKSYILYGYDKAKFSIRKHNFSIVVEGQMDVLLSHQAGYTNTVAVSGTALTLHQLTLLKRLSNNIVLAFDSDLAGVSAGGRGVDLALSLGMDVKMAALPKGSDPADLIVENPEKWKGVIRSAKHVVDFYLGYLCELYTDARKRRLEVGKTVLPYIAQIPNSIDQAHFVSRVAETLGMLEEPVWEEVRKLSQTRKDENQTPSESSPKADVKEVGRKESIEKRILAILLWQKELKKPRVAVTDVARKVQAIIGKKHYDALEKEIKEQHNELLFETEQLYETVTDIERDIDVLLAELEKEHVRMQYHEALENLKAAEGTGDKKHVEQALTQCKEISETLRSLEQHKA